MSDWHDDPGLYVSEIPGGWHAIYYTGPNGECHGTCCMATHTDPLAAVASALSMALDPCECKRCVLGPDGLGRQGVDPYGLRLVGGD